MKEFLKKDILAISISVAALLLSLASFYYNFLYVSNELVASAGGLELRGDSLTIEAVLLNKGNRPVLVRNIYGVYVHDKDDDGTDLYGSLGPLHSGSHLATVLEPGEIRLVSTTVPFVPADYYGSARPSGEKFEEYRDARNISVGMHFSAVDSEGAVAEHDHIFADIHMAGSGDSVATYRVVGREVRYGLVDIIE